MVLCVDFYRSPKHSDKYLIKKSIGLEGDTNCTVSKDNTDAKEKTKINSQWDNPKGYVHLTDTGHLTGSVHLLTLYI